MGVSGVWPEAELLQNQGERKDGEKKRRCLQMALVRIRVGC